MKKFVLFCFSFVLAFSLASYLGIFKDTSQISTKNGWRTYSKTKNNTITHYNSTPEELHTAKVSGDNTRGPASISNIPEPILKDKQDINSRIIIGDFDITKNLNLDNLVMSNELSQTWKESLSLELLRFHDNETKILIKEEDSILKVENGKGRFLEQVIISYLQDKNMLSSFRALVDSQSGQIIETWDRTIHEKIGHHDKEKDLSLPLYQNSGVEATIK